MKQLLEKCDVLFLQETSPNGGRPTGGLAVFWKTFQTTNFFPIMFTSTVMALKVQAMIHSFVLLNV